ncbi:MAG: phosphotriesterase family protein [Sagittula sp.]|uniref:phosphotriesterase family protein n=1 Tax=Sagittula sp. TaxID=2038081 RepID=UPI0040596B91
MKIQTVHGPIESGDMGRTMFHEHLLIMYPGAEYDSTITFDREALIAEAGRRLKQLREEHGVVSFVDPCPIELGRDADAMRRISDLSGLNIVCTTGFYFQPLGLPPYWANSTVEQVAELYVTELEKGIGDTGVRAGALKCATGEGQISDSERKCLAAACIAQKETGVRIITHTTSGTCGPDQQDIFFEAGIPANAMVIGHCCETGDNDYHRRIVDRGSYIGFDRIGWAQYNSDDARADALATLIEQGYEDQILLGQDRYTAMRGRYGRPQSAEEVMRMEEAKRQGAWPPPYTHLFTDFFPRMAARGVAEDRLYRMLDVNTVRFFSGGDLTETKAA